jgi:hypothetical protein
MGHNVFLISRVVQTTVDLGVVNRFHVVDSFIQIHENYQTNPIN